MALPDALIEHSSRARLLERFGLDAPGIAEGVRRIRAKLHPGNQARAG